MKNTVIGIFTDGDIEKYIFEKAFQKYGHKAEVHIFNTPEPGFRMAHETGFDIVFIEIHYWGETYGGFSILKQLNDISPGKMVAVGLTSLMQEGDLEKIIMAGFQICIEKPIVMESLDVFANFYNK